MSLWRDDKFLRLLSPQLERFKQKAAHTYNFRCPLCGDSEKNKFKSRGYIFPKQDVLMFKCHNCSTALPFSALLKRLSRMLYDEYILERLKEEGGGKTTTVPVSVVSAVPARPVPPRTDAKTNYPVYPLVELQEPTNPLNAVWAYAKNERKLPDSVMSRLYATSKAQTWLRALVEEEKAEKVEDGIAYLVQPFRLPNGDWYGAQLRMLERKEYLTFRWSHDPLKMFGLDAWNPDALTYVVEGPIDSLFVPNCLSPCGSDLLTGVRVLEDLNILKHSAPRVYVWDNEPRNLEITRHIRMAIKLHESVVIWPRGYPKDINDMVRAGIDVTTVLPKRTYIGLIAELEFSAWLKG